MIRLNKQEKDAIKSAIQDAYNGVMARCRDTGASDSETSSALYSIQDFLGSIDCDENGLNFNDVATVWIPFMGQRVTIQIAGMDRPQVGTITWHGMIDANWGGFSVTLDEKHPRYSMTIGPYRADYFRTIAYPIEG